MDGFNMKKTHVPTTWDNKWYYAIEESYALMRAQGIKDKTFAKFHHTLVSIFGACDYSCALFLWNKTRPDKQRKFYFN